MHLAGHVSYICFKINQITHLIEKIGEHPASANNSSSRYYTYMYIYFNLNWWFLLILIIQYQLLLHVHVHSTFRDNRHILLRWTPPPFPPFKHGLHTCMMNVFFAWKLLPTNAFYIPNNVFIDCKFRCLHDKHASGYPFAWKKYWFCLFPLSALFRRM